MVGIKAYGGYVPRRRLPRSVIVEANGWFNSGLKGYSKGERSMCNWDEDALTMAVEASRDCLDQSRPDDIKAIYLASTTLPFTDRQNSGILGTALNLGQNMMTMDITSSQRAGTSGLINALNVAKGMGGSALFAAGEHRRSQTANNNELMYGDGGAALLLGNDDVVAEYIGAGQIAVDFVDHYRGQNADFDYNWEERWIRDEGFMKIVPDAVQAALDNTGIAADEIDHFVMPGTIRNIAAMVGKRCGIKGEAARDNLHGVMGEAGTAHSLVMLVDCLQDAKPGELVMLIGWGQGCDALIFRTTDKLPTMANRKGIKGHLAHRKEETNYNKFLAFNGLVLQDGGLRSETDKQTALTTLYRNKEMVIGFVGGKCEQCGTVQFPKSRICVNPNCGAINTQEDHKMAETTAQIQSWTADNLTYAPDPPHHFGMVNFSEGGRMMADFTDVDEGGVAVGDEFRMVFRIKAADEKRGFNKYFWKAAPKIQAS
ncbi:MAG: hydroxymethylglutaryl-CoA synthase family protein [Alphaproteobacteria bacterium]|nr:hydroxymethylglutaryl-CoA synthase family protein [Alphaproteobacteria bacterium]